MQGTGGYRLKSCHQGPGPAHLPDSPSGELHTGHLDDSRSRRDRRGGGIVINKNNNILTFIKNYTLI